MERGRWGLFTLGNDAVYDWMLPLLESVRSREPDLPLHLIPFDDHLDRLAPLLDQYRVEIYAPPELAIWDRLGDMAYPNDRRSARCFRKLVAFDAPYDFHLYLDSDVVLLSPLGPLFSAVDERSPELVYFDRDVEQVYLPGALRTRFESRGLAQGFNTGLYCGRNRSFRREDFELHVVRATAEHRDEFASTAEQPFFNFVADSLEITRVGQWELLPEHCSTAWAAAGEFREEAGAWRLRGTSRWDEGWRLLFAHWAGYSFGPSLPNRPLLDGFRQRALERLEVASGPNRANRER